MKKRLFRLEAVKKNEEFRRIYKTAKRYHLGGITLYLRKNGLPYSRLGVSVSTRSGNSVVRHKFIRLVKEVFRLRQYEIKNGFDYIVVCGKNLSLGKPSSLNFIFTEEKLLPLFISAGVFISQPESIK